MNPEKDIRICKTCGRQYEVINMGDCFTGGKEREEVFCP